MAFEPEQKYENPDGTQIIFDTDILGAKRGENPLPVEFVNASESGKLVFQKGKRLRLENKTYIL